MKLRKVGDTVTLVAPAWRGVKGTITAIYSPRDSDAYRYRYWVRPRGQAYPYPFCANEVAL